MVIVEPGLLNQFCGDTPLQNAAFILPHIALPGKHLVSYAVFRITMCFTPIYKL